LVATLRCRADNPGIRKFNANAARSYGPYSRRPAVAHKGLYLFAIACAERDSVDSRTFYSHRYINTLSLLFLPLIHIPTYHTHTRTRTRICLPRLQHLYAFLWENIAPITRIAQRISVVITTVAVLLRTRILKHIAQNNREHFYLFFVFFFFFFFNEIHNMFPNKITIPSLSLSLSLSVCCFRFYY
jgi:hypothetical protein